MFVLLIINETVCVVVYRSQTAEVYSNVGLTSGYKYNILAGLPGFARDHCSIIMSISAFYF